MPLIVTINHRNGSNLGALYKKNKRENENWSGTLTTTNAAEALSQHDDGSIEALIRFYTSPAGFSRQAIAELAHILANECPNWHVDPRVVEYYKYRDFNRLVESFLKEDIEYLSSFTGKRKKQPLEHWFDHQLVDSLLTVLRILKYRLKRTRKVDSDNRRDILFSYPQLSVGGAERALVELANFLNNSGKKVDILLTSSKPQLVMKDKLKNGIRVLTYAEAMNSTYDYLVNYAHWISPRFVSGIIRAKRRIQFIHNDLASVFDFFPRTRFHREYKSIDIFVCVSDWVRYSFGLIYPDYAGKSRTVYNYYDQTMILERLASRPAILYDKSKNNIITLARLHPAKGIDRAIKAAARLKNDGLDFTWHIIGEGHERQRLTALITQHRLEGYVVLHGSVQNPFPEIKRSSFMVIPSYYEGYGLVALEAKIAGIPVVASDYGPVREIIQDGVDGLVVANSIDGMTNGIRRLLTDEALRISLSADINDAIEYVCRRNEEIKRQLTELFPRLDES